MGPTERPKRASKRIARNNVSSLQNENSTTYAKKLRTLMNQKKETGKGHTGKLKNQPVDPESKLDEVPTFNEKQSCQRVINGQSAFNFEFSAREKEPFVWTNHMFPALERSLNFIHHQYQASIGLLSHPRLHHAQGVTGPVVNMVSNMQLYRTGSPFDRRVTAMEWHSTNPNVLAVASKGGDIYLWDTETVHNSDDNFMQGMGAGGSIQALKFWPWDDKRLLTSSIDGRVTLHDIEGRKTSVLADTLNCHDFWYCSVDVSASRKVVVTGDNVGNTLMLSPEGKKIWSHKLHKGKVTHTEFSPREDWLLCTASIDHRVQLWDIRMISGKNSALCSLQHDKGVNSAYFSGTDGCRLLTTDQGSEIRVYRAPEWTLEQTIHHPHRFFQHITPIKANWHPLQDLITVGRYPDKTFPGFTEAEKRTIDVFDAASGKMVCQLHDPNAPGIVSLNKFSPRGDKLASGMGFNILIWSRKEEVLHQQEALLKSLKQQQRGGSSIDSTQRRQRRKPPSMDAKTKTQQKKDSELMTKLKAKTKKV